MTWCWWCCHPFEGPELHMPIKYDEPRKRFTTMGTFCSWGCMKAYNIDRAGPKYGEYQMMITLMRKHAYGRIESYTSAPKRQCLKVFGGTMSIDEFRGCKDPPFVQMPNQLLMVCHQGPSDQKKEMQASSENKMNSINNATGQTEQLKLKRSKPLKREESALEKSLGIRRKT